MKWSRSACASADPSVGSVPAPSSSRSTSVSGPAASTIRVIDRRWPENVESDCATDCSSPMSAKTSRSTGSELPASAGTWRPAWCMRHRRPIVRSVTVLPPVFGPVTTSAVNSPPRSTSIGTTRPERPGWRALLRTIRGEPVVSARVASISPARRALALHRSKRASASTVAPSAGALAPTSAESSSRIRSTSTCSASCASRQAFPSSTAMSGSTKTVWPLPDASWTIPFTRPRASARTGTT